MNVAPENLDDDALSTITEATEPDTASLHSFTSSCSSRKPHESSDERLFSEKEFNDQTDNRNFRKTDKNDLDRFDRNSGAENQVNTSSPDVSLSDSTLTSEDIDIQKSYTIAQQRTIESAMATGLPIITESMKQSHDKNAFVTQNAISSDIHVYGDFSSGGTPQR